MPSSVVKSIAAKSGKSVETVEKIWNETKEEAEKKFKKKDSHFWAYVNSVTHRKCGINEDQLSFKSYLEVVSE
jgi:hypothetical protein